ncbi:hypothetical protein EYC80_006574 [Monilinia laxa]|uniref:Uncharacterized protein n=1 Tax=Monilinia laxa TaxID=61186 RepID=A0A5N6JSC2_MONLA|nr:hypothetical protein EYC80_006574 [Monilinia laxa]
MMETKLPNRQKEYHCEFHQVCQFIQEHPTDQPVYKETIYNKPTFFLLYETTSKVLDAGLKDDLAFNNEADT